MAFEQLFERGERQPIVQLLHRKNDAGEFFDQRRTVDTGVELGGGMAGVQAFHFEPCFEAQEKRQ